MEIGQELEEIHANPPSEPYVSSVPLRETNEIDDTDTKMGEGVDVRKGLVVPVAGDEETPTTKSPVGSSAPKDVFHAAYAVYFILGAGFLLPWNAFITAVDYFSYLYRGTPVDRVFSVSYMVIGLLLLLVIVFWARRSSAHLRINAGLALFVAALLVVPVMDAAYVRGVRGRYAAFDVTVGAVVLSGIADALVQSGVIGSAGELPERYMQAVVAGTAASGTDSFSDLCFFHEYGTRIPGLVCSIDESNHNDTSSLVPET
ncbi:Nucleoside transporter [Musa troglodytarum]|uniref:Nucleoside transporter n=1 Tax=Musa troglodytarum TaxID=320322 RepID=A0A9E7IA12_9LILI|nr:Nucleoside transporter [Musa troglodytarum]